MSARLAPSLALAALAAGCGLDPLAGGAPVVRDFEQVVPFEVPPPYLVDQPANNNLDVVRHDGRVFLAFRTAPTHFASELTTLWVVSSDDEKTWEVEASFAEGTDLREPRFLSYGGRLFLYFAVLGKDPLKFEPQGTKVSERLGPGAFSEATWWTDQPTFIPWRMKVSGGVAYMIGYTGGENIYDLDGLGAIEVQWLRSDDGLAWTAAGAHGPTVEVGGGSETDWVFQDDGSVVAVTRNELGDAAFGWGSKVCRAEAADPGTWYCRGDKRKFDSPQLFRVGGDVWLIGRRNLTETGNYDLELRDLSPKDQTGKYLVEYSFSPKTCSLWRVDPDALEVTWAADLPARGDTCFPSVLPGDPAQGVGEPLTSPVRVYNYTSPLDGPPEEITWLYGQGNPTLIYHVDVDF